ncbi:MAG: hypothetical protein JEZ06_04030 [Anaerolineaceae bacterium]|nr:hypothetical protein [Anaerolineaceae bacterium]
MTERKFKLKKNKTIQRLALLLAVFMPFVLYYAMMNQIPFLTLLSSVLVIAAMILIILV